MGESSSSQAMDVTEEYTHDIENQDALRQSLLRKRNQLSASHLAMVGAKVSHIESLDYEINESDLFKHDWRNRTTTEVLQYVSLKWAMAFLVGLLTGVIASGINLAIENIAGYKMLTVVNFVREERYLAGFWYFSGVNLALTAIAATLCVLFAPTAAGPGIPEIKAYLNGVDTPDMFGVNVLLVKIVGSIGAVAAGLDLGKEGPLVHIGACIASLLSQGGSDKYRLKWKGLKYFKNDRDRRDLITCGSSAGVCAAFRSPIGGVLFSLEEVATWWRNALLWRAFFSTALVVVVLRGFIELCNSGKCGLFGAGGLILFDVSEVMVTYHIKDLLPVTIVGILGGVLGGIYNILLPKVLRVYSMINEKGRLAKFLLAIGVCVFTSVALYFLPFLATCQPCDESLDAICPTTGRSGNFKQFNCPNGYYNDLATLLHATSDDAVRNIFSTSTPNEFRTFSLSIFFAIYCILGLFTFGIAVPSGLFLPIILMGSAYGRLVAKAFSAYIQIDPGLYAVLGAASLMAGVMRMTVSVCIIFLELTNNLLLLPIMMFVLLISKTIGDAFNPSIYEIILDMKGLPFLEANPEPWMRNITVGQLADAKPKVISLKVVEKVSRIVEVLRHTSHNGFPVIDLRSDSENSVKEIHGLVLRSHLIKILSKKWFQEEGKRTTEQEVRANFSPVELAEKPEQFKMDFTEEELDKYVDLHHFANTTPYTVVETMSAAKAMVLFRQVALRHLLIVPKYQGPEIEPIVGILTRQDLRAHNILNAFPDAASHAHKN
ncbi:chloride channel protein CLC-a-like isoform X1 [Carex rostrata]